MSFQESVAPTAATTDEKIIGKPLSRIDGRLKVMGKATYSAEYDLPGLVHGVTVQSTIANGKIQEIDTREAESVPGVRLVLTHKNAPKLNPQEDRMAQGGGIPGEQNQSPLQSEAIHYDGQHIALVLADTFEQARYAATLIKVTYEVLPGDHKHRAGQRNALRAQTDARRGSADLSGRPQSRAERRVRETRKRLHHPDRTS